VTVKVVSFLLSHIPFLSLSPSIIFVIFLSYLPYSSALSLFVSLPSALSFELSNLLIPTLLVLYHSHTFISFLDLPSISFPSFLFVRPIEISFIEP
jgi:hypothetical protein